MKTIIWDVDDVLNDFMFDWFEKQWLIVHPECKLKYEDLLENPPHKILGTSLNEYRNSLDDYRSQNGSTFNPVPEVLEWFRAKGSNYRHMALTAVPLSLAHISADWVFRHFGNWIRSFNVVPSPRLTDPAFFYDLSKKDFLSSVDSDCILIDDNLINIKSAQSLGIKTIVFPRPWNGTTTNRIEILKHL
jgi:FMN phosphatase YigB (HAD superfamily)